MKLLNSILMDSVNHKKITSLYAREHYHLKYYPMMFLTKKGKNGFQILQDSKYNPAGFLKRLPPGTACAFVRVFQRQRTERMWIYRKRFILRNWLM